jgi:IclR family acetate operon transcriptional repressor
MSPLHASGIGKALLAHAGAERLARLTARGLRGYTAHTITYAARLGEEFEEVRRCGYSLDNEERAEGMRCVAAPIRDVFGETVAGLSVSGPVSRVTPERVPAFAREVIAAADAVSAALGARTTPPRES